MTQILTLLDDWAEEWDLFHCAWTWNSGDLDLVTADLEHLPLPCDEKILYDLDLSKAVLMCELFNWRYSVGALAMGTRGMKAERRERR